MSKKKTQQKQKQKQERDKEESTTKASTRTLRRRKKSRSWVVFALLFVVGYLTWQNIQVSIHIPTNNTNTNEDALQVAAGPHRSMDQRGGRRSDEEHHSPLPKHIQEHPTGSTSSVSHNNSSTTTTIPSFPRWSDPQGISWSAIEAYIRMADQDLDHSRDLLECPPGVICVHDAPNVLYIFGASNDPGFSSTATTTTPQVYVEQRRRKLVGPGFAKRYPIVEELLHRSLDYLWTTSTNHNATTTNNFPRLRTLLFSSSSSSVAAGIPLILNLGDNQQCFHHNLKAAAAAAGDDDNDKDSRYLSVPVLTLAVPVNCHHAFPIPHPAALDTAKVYGTNWAAIQGRRATKYPFSEQFQQAVWRGSPTGNKNIRQRLVYHANTSPNDNRVVSTADDERNTTTTNTTTIFDVGFGKHYHKIVPSYHGPRIWRRPKLFFEDFGQYAVVLDVDGSSWSERFPSLVCLRSVIAKIRPQYVDWLWPTIQASKHYIDVDVFDHDNEEKEDQTSNTTRRLWSLMAALLQNETQRLEILHATHQWCDHHMVYSQMIHDFLTSLEFYVEQLDKGDDDSTKQHKQHTTTPWYEQWDQLLQHDMPPAHHHWQALPVEEAKPYFGLWRDTQQ